MDGRGTAERSRSPRGPTSLEESAIPITYVLKTYELDNKRKIIEVYIYINIY